MADESERAAAAPIATELLVRQTSAILSAWSMSAGDIEACCRAMSYADLRGIDTHGVAMLPTYFDQLKQGKLKPDAKIELVREAGSLALFDAGHGLGHPVSEVACRWAIDRARQTGVAGATVRHSNHYGAAGYYAMLAAEAGMFGVSVSGTPGRTVVPPLGKEPCFGALPIAFAAGAASGMHLNMDMAVSTVAMGKINLARLAGKSIPEGWAVDESGRPLTDADEAFKLKRLTPFGGHKGYGLGVMVEVLASLVSGSKVGGATLGTNARGPTLDIGHTFLVLDARGLFEDPSSFGAAVDLFGEHLRSTSPIDPGSPVMAPGDPERRIYFERKRSGIPVLPNLLEEIRRVARESDAEILI
ncbi:MAG: Ldh family oxidoreductase [Tagaea sp.]|nr:Ldh family oxidoreductase [Tagaea sp.]